MFKKLAFKHNKIPKENLATSILSATITIGAALTFISQSSGNIFVTVFAILFVISLLIASYFKIPIKLKYMLAGISFTMLVLINHFYPFSFNHLSTISIFIPFIYAYVLPEFFSPIIFGSFLVLLCLKSAGGTPLPEIIGKGSGIMFSSILFAFIFHLNRKLEYERNQYQRQSISDSLTGVAHLNYIIQLGEHFLRKDSSVAAYVMDINQFKVFNDTYGHLIGNKVLIELALLLSKELENIDGIVGRLGGDEFVILTKNYSYQQAEQFYKKLSHRLKEEIIKCDPDLDPVKISCSIGMAYAPPKSNISIQELLHRADVHMYYIKQKRDNIQLENQIERLLSDDQKLLLDSLAEKDMYSYVHTQYVVQHAINLAQALKLPSSFIEEIGISGWLHDIGKILIPNEILRKRERLTDLEYNVVKGHVENGINILTPFNLTETILNGIRYHHERFDGTGYPYGLLGNETPLEARILQIADAYSAMTVKRVYRPLLSPEEALNELIKKSGSQFDPELVQIFIELSKNPNK